MGKYASSSKVRRKINLPGADSGAQNFAAGGSSASAGIVDRFKAAKGIPLGKSNKVAMTVGLKKIGFKFKF